MFRRKKPQIQMTLEQCLLGTIVRNPEAREQDLDGGRVQITLPYLKPWLVRLFSRKSRTFPRKFELDETGAELWRMIDGKRTVSDLAEHLQRSRGFDEKQATDSMVAYLNMLLVRGIVGLVVPEDSPES